MLELLRDPVWLFIGAAIALIALGFTFLVYLLQRTRKELVFGVISSRALLRMESKASDRISVLFDGVAVKNVHMIVCAFKNSGTVPIRSLDYEAPLAVDLGQNATVLDARVSATRPTDLIVRCTSNDCRIQIEPLLLNPGDQITLEILVSVEVPEVVPRARVVGITGVAAAINSFPAPSFASAVGFSAKLTAAAAGGLFAPIILISDYAKTNLTWSQALLAIGPVFLLPVLFWALWSLKYPPSKHVGM